MFERQCLKERELERSEVVNIFDQNLQLKLLWTEKKKKWLEII
jgi:hypothetical protein